MAEESHPKRSTFAIREVFNLIGGVSGLLSIGLLVFKGGAITQVVTEHERRIEWVERNGSASLGEHVKYDDERVKNLNERVIRVEGYLAVLPAVQRDVAVMDVKLDTLIKAVDASILKPKTP